MYCDIIMVQDKLEFIEVIGLNYEKSCGAVVFTRLNNNIKYILIQNLEGNYGFPKGHVEDGESEMQTTMLVK